MALIRPQGRVIPQQPNRPTVPAKTNGTGVRQPEAPQAPAGINPLAGIQDAPMDQVNVWLQPGEYPLICVTDVRLFWSARSGMFKFLVEMSIEETKDIPGSLALGPCAWKVSLGNNANAIKKAQGNVRTFLHAVSQVPFEDLTDARSLALIEGRDLGNLACEHARAASAELRRVQGARVDPRELQIDTRVQADRYEGIVIPITGVYIAASVQAQQDRKKTHQNGSPVVYARPAWRFVAANLEDLMLVRPDLAGEEPQEIDDNDIAF